MWGTFGPALLASSPALPDSWLTAIGNAKVLIAVWLLGLAIYIGVIVLRRKRRPDTELRHVADDQPFVAVPDDGQTIIVYAKKPRVALNMLRLTISASVFIAFNVVLFFDPRFQWGVVSVAIFDLLIGAAVVFDAVHLLFLAVCFFSNAPILMVNAEGITDNATFIATGMGLIPWREISDVFIYNRGLSLRLIPTRRLIIVGKNKTFVRQQPLWKRALHALWPAYLDLAHIPEFLLPMPIEELCAQIEEYARAHGHTLRSPSWMRAGVGPSTSAD